MSVHVMGKHGGTFLTNSSCPNSMHERNAHNFPLDLAAGEVVPVAMEAPTIHA